jgi:23S rRNA (uracil1939-C5)-methyltransferase
MNGQLYDVTITKLVNGGQGLGALPDGRTVFVWNTLPGEVVRARIIKQKRHYTDAIAEEVITASPDRIAPQEVNYLATSPWQIMSPKAENQHKIEIVRELFTHAHIATDAFDLHIPSGQSPEFNLKHSKVGRISRQSYGLKSQEQSSGDASEPGLYQYRNKMEYSFWGDDNGLHLALYRRGSHAKHIVNGSALALPAVDAAARAICAQLQAQAIRAADLKSVVVRCDQAGNAVAALYVKPQRFVPLQLSPELQGIRVYHSNPKSPASVATKLLQQSGQCELTDSLLGRNFMYDVDSFFQVNLPVYEQALADIMYQCQGDPVDMYAGVGSIGLSIAKKHVTLVELDASTAAMARRNAEAAPLDATVIQQSTEQSLGHITAAQPVIFDPPRAGLHPAVITRCLQALPPQILYLSCNPVTQARDVTLLQEAYTITYLRIFNFFPRTPHIETLAVLRLR